jgi:sterol desaturase/sphingolipid hydroxylase (fatty acid hydroxylase superfamily)
MANSTILSSKFSSPLPGLGIEPAWESLVVSYPPQTIEFFGTILVQLLAFWLPCLLFQALDTLFPIFSHRHKIQPIPKQPTAAELRYCLQIVLRNQLFSTILHLLLLTSQHYLHHKPSSNLITPSLPSLASLLWQLPACILLRELLFYHSHLLLHHPRLYAPIHKFHHRFVAPVALAAQFAHPAEHLFANILPVSLPPQILGAHVLTNWLFLAFVLVETTAVHSGYDFAGGMARMHDLHHERFVGNYGTVGVLDWVYGTYRRRGEKVAVE